MKANEVKERIAEFEKAWEDIYTYFHHRPKGQGYIWLEIVDLDRKITEVTADLKDVVDLTIAKQKGKRTG